MRYSFRELHERMIILSEIKYPSEGVSFPVLLTPKPASKQSGVPEHLIRKLIADGTVISVPAGNRRYVNMQSLHDYISGRANR